MRETEIQTGTKFSYNRISHRAVEVVEDGMTVLRPACGTRSKSGEYVTREGNGTCYKCKGIWNTGR
jgi:hypothetical protein